MTLSIFIRLTVRFPQACFYFGGHPGTPGVCLKCFQMIFSDFWDRKKVKIFPIQKIFILALWKGPQRASQNWPLEAKNGPLVGICACRTIFDPGNGFKPIFYAFSESRDDFRYDMHFYGIFWRFMVSEGSPRENRPKDPKKALKKRDFPIK